MSGQAVNGTASGIKQKKARTYSVRSLSSIEKRVFGTAASDE
jgi:hypothetical protein